MGLRQIYRDVGWPVHRLLTLYLADAVQLLAPELEQASVLLHHAYQQEKTDYITGNTIKKLIKNGPMKSIPRLLQHIHFDPEHEENHKKQIKLLKKKTMHLKK